MAAPKPLQVPKKTEKKTATKKERRKTRKVIKEPINKKTLKYNKLLMSKKRKRAMNK